ncbi:MAG: DUF1015 domain-containing protein [Ruminococcus sp.]|nr:DUF1015 domain-containing protein [Ruminococcus sp.]
MNNAFRPADILIPNKNVNINNWAVIACDQYTSEAEYWQQTEKIVENDLSTLNLILPEIFLENDNVADRIKNIHNNMDKYLADGIFDEYKNSMIYIERIQSNGILRAGILGMIDLEEYDFSKGSTSQVRATEATVIERIPPRVKIRDGASLELPHIMILIDDENKTVIEPLENDKNKMQKLYDFELMQNGGKISGYLIDNDKCSDIISKLDILGDAEGFRKKYNCSDILLYAMGDGNHSLATAKEFYEQLKKNNPDKDFSNHPARYALAEIVNLHSPALDFEAIHRIITDADTDKLFSEMTNTLGLSETPSEQSFTYILNGIEKTLYIHNKNSNLTVGSLQNFLDKYLSENKGKIDYIHGTDTVRNLAKQKNSIGFILPDMAKSELFPTVIKDGALPRKTFSMGHAEDKRYYIECRKIK